MLDVRCNVPVPDTRERMVQRESPVSSDAGLSGSLVCMDILGSVVLIDPDTGSEYAAGQYTETVTSTWGVGILGGIVLIDPATGNPYKLGEN